MSTRLVPYGAETATLQVEKNELYEGNFEGYTPTIDNITVMCVSTETALQDVAEGRLDVVNKIPSGRGCAIFEGMALTGKNALSVQNYLRTGLSFISFVCEQAITQSVNVRKALAKCVDVISINNEFTQGNGAAVYGYYGMGQWMAL